MLSKTNIWSGLPPQYINVIADVNMPTPANENNVTHVVYRDFDFTSSFSFFCLSINTNAAINMDNDPATMRNMVIFLFAPHSFLDIDPPPPCTRVVFVEFESDI